MWPQAEIDAAAKKSEQAFNLRSVARYDAKQAEVFRKTILAIRDAVPGGHEPDLEGLVIVIQQLVAQNTELKEQRDRWYGKAIERAGLTPNYSGEPLPTTDKEK